MRTDTTAEIHDTEVQDIIDKWARLGTVMGEWDFADDLYGTGDWIARDCQTHIGPLAGPPVQLRVATVTRVAHDCEAQSASPPVSLRVPTPWYPGPRRWVGQVRCMGLDPRVHGPGAVLLVLDEHAGKPDAGWETAEEAKSALESLLFDKHCHKGVQLCGYEGWVRHDPRPPDRAWT